MGKRLNWLPSSQALSNGTCRRRYPAFEQLEHRYLLTNHLGADHFEVGEGLRAEPTVVEVHAPAISHDDGFPRPLAVLDSLGDGIDRRPTGQNVHHQRAFSLDSMLLTFETLNSEVTDPDASIDRGILTSSEPVQTFNSPGISHPQTIWATDQAFASYSRRDTIAARSSEPLEFALSFDDELIDIGTIDSELNDLNRDKARRESVSNAEGRTGENSAAASGQSNRTRDVISFERLFPRAIWDDEQSGPDNETIDHQRFADPPIRPEMVDIENDSRWVITRFGRLPLSTDTVASDAGCCLENLKLDSVLVRYQAIEVHAPRVETTAAVASDERGDGVRP